MLNKMNLHLLKPVESDDSCLIDSGDSNEDYTPVPGDESSTNNAIILCSFNFLFTYGHVFVNVTMGT